MIRCNKLLSYGSCLSHRSFHTTRVYAKGHSHWQNTRHIKAANDCLRSQRNSQHVKLMRLAFIEGGSIPDPAKNAPLKKAIEKAAKQNVPRQTIQNALQRLAANNGETKRHVFEGRLFGKVTALICINTDHMQLAKNLVANAFKKYHVQPSNSVRRSFVERGTFYVTLKSDAFDVANIEETCLSIAIECGAEDIRVDDAAMRRVTFFSDASEFENVRQKLAATGHTIEYADCVFYPNTPLVHLLTEERIVYDKLKNRLALIEGLDAVYDNVIEEDE